MSEFLFYHAAVTDTRKVTVELLKKSVQQNKRVILRLRNEQTVEDFDAYLWEFSKDEFLPHGTHNDPFPDKQPVYLTYGDENPNEANFLMMLSGTRPSENDNFERSIFIFDDHDIEAKDHARSLWQELKAADKKVIYRKQDPQKGWVER